MHLALQPLHDAGVSIRQPFGLASDLFTTGLVRPRARGRSLVPCPPAITTAFISILPSYTNSSTPA
ncbi:MAG: hypothetical protein WBH57_12565 [Anaerolineae bacterium]